MQRFLFSVLLLCLQAAALWGQNPSCQAYAWPIGWENGQTILSAYDSSAAAVSGYMWSNGATTKDISVTGTGTFCVTITYADGCTASDCHELDGTCEVLAGWGPADNGGYELAAMAYPTHMFQQTTYLWSNGSTEQFTIVTAPGTYCVTATQPNGCTATKCTEITLNTDCDFGWIIKQNMDGTPAPFIEARPLAPSNNYTWLWNTGATTKILPLYANGNYCCTVTNTDFGCQKIKCTTITNITCTPVVLQPSGNTLTAVATDPASTPVSYLWNTGATTQSIIFPGSGYFAVTVTFASGCSTEQYTNIQPNNCTASIFYNPDNTLTAQSTGTAPFTYAWSPGNASTQTISPTQPGTQCVTITDATGCQKTDCRYWYDATSCTVDLLSYPDSSGTWLQASSPGQDWAYLWSDGSTSNGIYPTAAGEYCVTATNTVTGCTAVRCYWVQPGDACKAHINAAQTNLLDWTLTTVSGPVAATSYAWSTGAATPSITTNQAGYYSVTVTNTAGCTVSAYYVLYKQTNLVTQVSLPDSAISGSNGVHALLYLIRYDAAQGGTLTGVDTVETYSWTNSSAIGQFNDVQPGHYLIKAALLPGSNGYADHLPTYYGNSLLWSDATTYTYSGLVSVNTWPQQAHILLTPGQNPGGPGFIGGLVSDGANFTGGGGEHRGEGDPVGGISIVLTLPDGTPVAHATTDANGQYSFPNLAWGTYVLTIDVPGLTPVSTTVTIGPGQPSATGINFKIDDDSAAVSGTDDLGAAGFVKIFPNPVRDVLWVESVDNAQLTLTNATGQTLRQLSSSSQRTQVTVADLPSGMYFLTVRTAAAMQTLKVVKE